MVYYIRFLKTPRVQQQKGSSVVSALFCITTDLGDAFLAQDVDLIAELAISHSSKILSSKSLTWQAGKRELPISLELRRGLAQQPVVLTVRPLGPQSLVKDSLCPIPLVVSGWSTPISAQLPAEKLIERRFSLGDSLESQTSDLCISEETGNSIARHIWDAALASVIYLHQIISGASEGMPSLRHLLQHPRQTPLQVIELGAGCGIVGIALAQLHPHCSVLLTDLPEVEEIVTRNINAARPAPKSTVYYQSLDWNKPPPDGLCRNAIDLILLSDCTYNVDSLPALVSTLDRLVRSSPGAIILVALKRRHDSETVFFDLMQSAAFQCLQDRIPLPSQHDQVDQIELYCYSR
ncbi:hypothetical protein N7510_007221 [Penicillium lagena]|uniref:uncharacterized protein n=1 Tax=Penicillium lagena TaxID=94218 RepID=UPI002540C964|nr:uncharacterized protein N7510_007221 [Penicillium lagena]KAJ5610502.1 hypothetical protein N7510_007221 [Penicillium lagena]